MRIAFVSILRFPCAVEVRRQPSLAGQPLIIGDADQPKRVLDCSEEASSRGVRCDMTIRQALSHCPEATVLPPDPVLYRATWESVLDALGEVSPEIEDEDLGRAYANVEGLEGHYRDEKALASHLIATVLDASSLEAAAGIGEGKFPALAASTTCGPRESCIMPAGSERIFLAPLSIRLLPIEARTLSRLDLLGLEYIGDIATLTAPSS